jgi:hypothetical protein
MIVETILDRSSGGGQVACGLPGMSKSFHGSDSRRDIKAERVQHIDKFPVIFQNCFARKP